MEISKKKLVRTAFRKAVFERDGYCCKCCSTRGKDRQGGDAHKQYHPKNLIFPDNLAELDAHHIFDRHLMPNGGYVAENGISVCGPCHEKAEAYWIIKDAQLPKFSPEHLFFLIGSSFEQAIEVSERLDQV